MATLQRSRLSTLDASFLDREQGPAHMHIGVVATFDGEAPGRDELIDHVAARLHRVPRYRQKVIMAPLGAGRPLWVDDPRFRLEYHVRRTALAPPATRESLRRLAGRVFSQRLDRSKPLWELWVVEGVIATDGSEGFALISKAHEAMVGGVAGGDLLSVLFEVESNTLEPLTSTAVAAPLEAWVAGPEPTPAELTAEALRDLATAPALTAERAARSISSPDRALRTARGLVRDGARTARSLVSSPPRTPINVKIGPHRDVDWVGFELSEIKAIKNALGGTVNDVVITIVAGALRSWLHSRGVPTEGLDLRAGVPVSLGAPGADSLEGHRIAMLDCPLPVSEADPIARLARVRGTLEHLKSTREAVGAEVITAFEDFAPATLFAQASRITPSPRHCNVVVTNLPGPPGEVDLLGRPVRELAPLGAIADGFALKISVVSYNGALTFGLLADADALPDIDVLAQSLRSAVEELLHAT